jgi:hypothetical protein
MKNHIYFLFLIPLLILSSCIHKNKDYITVNEGVGFNDIILMKTLKSDIIKLIGDKFEQTNHNGSIEMFYKKQGLSFYYDSHDKAQRIDFINFDNKFYGKTSKGFEIRSMTLNDVLRIYGNPSWRFSNEKDEIHACYEDLGIEFNINMKVKIHDSIPTSYFTEDVYINRMLLSYFKSIYGADKIKEFTILIPDSTHWKRPFLGKSEIDSVFQVKVSKHSVSLLNDRLIANAPEESSFNEDSSYIWFEKNKQSFTISLTDYHCMASNDLKTDIDKIIKSWNEKSIDFKLKEIINKKDISIYVIEPIKIRLVDDVFLLNSAFVKNIDNTILFVKFFINTNAWYNLKNYQSLSNEIIKSIMPGNKSLNVKSELVQINTQQRVIVIKKPNGLIFTKNNGPDFRVFNFEKLVRFNESQSSMLIYIGNDPNYLYNQNDEPVVIDKINGLLFGHKIEWNFCYKDKSQKFPYTIEGICKIDSFCDVHVALMVYSIEDVELFKKSLPDTEF